MHKRSKYSGRITEEYNKVIQDYLTIARDNVLDTKDKVTAIDVGVGLGIKSSNNLKTVGGIEPILGIDIDDERLKKAREAYAENGYQALDFIQADLMDHELILPYQADIVTCTDVLEHLVQPEIAMQHIYNLSDRYAILASPNEPNFRGTTLVAALTRLKYHQRWEYIKRLGLDPEHVQKFNKKSFSELIESNGFNILDLKQTILNRWNVVLAEKV